MGELGGEGRDETITRRHADPNYMEDGVKTVVPVFRDGSSDSRSRGSRASARCFFAANSAGRGTIIVPDNDLIRASSTSPRSRTPFFFLFFFLSFYLHPEERWTKSDRSLSLSKKRKKRKETRKGGEGVDSGTVSPEGEGEASLPIKEGDVDTIRFCTHPLNARGGGDISALVKFAGPVPFLEL